MRFKSTFFFTVGLRFPALQMPRLHNALDTWDVVANTQRQFWGLQIPLI